MNINLDAIINASQNLKEIMVSTPKNAKTKKTDHLMAVQLIKNNLTQASHQFKLAGIPNLSEASELLLKEVEKVTNIKKDHRLEYSRIRIFVSSMLNSLSQKKSAYH